MRALASSHHLLSLKAFFSDASVWRAIGAWAFVGAVCVVLANALS